jgi:hypothetical protein
VELTEKKNIKIDQLKSRHITCSPALPSIRSLPFRILDLNGSGKPYGGIPINPC